MTINKSLVLLALQIVFFVNACEATGTSLVAKQGTNVVPTAVIQRDNPTNINPTQTLNVFAAASLTDAFMTIGIGFEATHPGVKVNFNFAGSQILRTQLEQGAVADIVAFADQKNMDASIADNLVAADEYQDFATNSMTIILPPSNPGTVSNIKDLARPGLKLVVADASVPAGEYARQVLTNLSKDPANGPDFNSKVMANLVSNETDVRQVVTKVELGEADAGIVYASDAIAAQELITIPIPDQFNVVAHYPIAILSHSPNRNLASAFVEYVASPSGQAIMSEWGFTPVHKP